ncbi:MAG: hypothetical protein D6695_09555, partial [Planctomycetota bacterium]
MAAIAGSATLATAQAAEAFRVDAINGNGTGSFVVTFEDGTWDGNVWTYELDQARDLGPGVGSIESALIVITNNNRTGGQTVSLNFNVAAGALNTVFDVASGNVAAALASAMGAASAGFSVTDTLGDGATLAPDGDAIYTASYNNESSTFAQLLTSPVSAGAFSTASAFAEFPGGGGYAPLTGAVTDISARWTFAVSAFDVASGTSVFTVIPSPASLALLGLGGLAIRRRR